MLEKKDKITRQLNKRRDTIRLNKKTRLKLGLYLNTSYYIIVTINKNDEKALYITNDIQQIQRKNSHIIYYEKKKYKRDSKINNSISIYFSRKIQKIYKSLESVKEVTITVIEPHKKNYLYQINY